MIRGETKHFSSGTLHPSQVSEHPGIITSCSSTLIIRDYPLLRRAGKDASDMLSNYLTACSVFRFYFILNDLC